MVNTYRKENVEPAHAPAAQPARPDLRLFRYALAIADEGGFGRAAARLGISQPPLSQRIAELEAALGLKLFERRADGARPTAAGIVFLDEARLALHAAHRAMALGQAAGRGEAGALSLALSGGSMFGFLPRQLQLFREEHPDIRLTIRNLAPDDQITQIADGRVDAGITRLAPAGRGVSLAQVHEEGFVVAMHATEAAGKVSPMRLSDLARRPFVMFQREGSGFHSEVTALCLQAGFVPDVVQEISPIHAVLGLVEAGFGVAVVPESARILAFPHVVYRRLVGLEKASRLYLATHESERSPQCERLIAHLRGAAAATPASTAGRRPRAGHDRRIHQPAVSRLPGADDQDRGPQEEK